VSLEVHEFFIKSQNQPKEESIPFFELQFLCVQGAWIMLPSLCEKCIKFHLFDLCKDRAKQQNKIRKIKKEYVKVATHFDWVGVEMESGAVKEGTSQV
jgi:hypothetical protein